MRAYIALIHKESDSDFGVSFPDLPGCITAGETLDEAYRMAAEALALHLQAMADDGEASPEPSSLEEIMADPDNRGGVAVVVPAPRSTSRAVGVNITLPNDLLDTIDMRAKAEGLTRSGFLAQAARAVIEAPLDPAPDGSSRRRSRATKAAGLPG